MPGTPPDGSSPSPAASEEAGNAPPAPQNTTCEQSELNADATAAEAAVATTTETDTPQQQGDAIDVEVIVPSSVSNGCLSVSKVSSLLSSVLLARMSPYTVVQRG